MWNNKNKHNPFGASFNPKEQPGFQTRYGVSLDRFLGGANIVNSPDKPTPQLEVRENLRTKFGSGQVPQLLPSYFDKVRVKARG